MNIEQMTYEQIVEEISPLSKNSAAHDVEFARRILAARDAQWNALIAGQAEPVAWWRVSYVDEEGFSDADVQIGANVPTILPDNGFPWWPLYGPPIPVRPAAHSPDGKAEQAEAPVYMTVEDCMRIIRAHAPDDLKGMEAAFRANTFATQPTASNAGERELRFLTQKELDSIGRHAEGMDGQQWDRWVQEKFAEVNNLKVQGAAYGY